MRKRLTEEEYLSMREKAHAMFPPQQGHVPKLARAQIYPTTGFARVIDAEGELHTLEPGEYVKILADDEFTDAPWRYKVKEVRVVFPGGFHVELKEGVALAPLGPDPGRFASSDAALAGQQAR